MGCSPWGCKEWDTTEPTEHIFKSPLLQATLFTVLLIKTATHLSARQVLLLNQATLTLERSTGRPARTWVI